MFIAFLKAENIHVMAPNSELFSYLTCLLMDTSKYIVQLLRGVAASLCGVTNLSIELNGTPLSDSKRVRVS